VAAPRWPAESRVPFAWRLSSGLKARAVHSDCRAKRHGGDEQPDQGVRNFLLLSALRRKCCYAPLDCVFDTCLCSA
jgi:hypothetical protein